MNIPIFTPVRDYQNHKSKYDEAVLNVMASGNYIMGQPVKDLENCLANYVGVKHCISMSSGTDALLAALMAYDISVGDKVIVPPFTWISTSEVVSLIGAIPVFIDIEENTYNLDANEVRKYYEQGGDAKAILAVSLYGHIANLPELQEIADKYGAKLIEDGAQSFGAKLGDKYSCGITEIGCTSFFPSKPLGCYGDGGACFTNNDVLADKLRAIRTHGGIKRCHHEYVGFNGRLDTIQAVILNIKMLNFEDTVLIRNIKANIYNNAFKDLEDVICPKIEENNRHGWGQYTLRILNRDRDEVRSKLKDAGIGTGVYYSICLADQPVYDKVESEVFGDLSITKKVKDEVLSIPVFPDMTEEEQNHIIQTILDILS